MRPLCPLHLLLLAFLSLTSLTTCHPRPRDSSIPATSNLSKSTQTSDHLLPDPQSNLRAPSSLLLLRRSRGFQSYLDIGSGWNMYYSSWPSIALPVQPAAWALTNLYASILLHARGKWSKSPPQHGFTITCGGLRILMHCQQKPIPWLFVGNLAEKLLQITEGGWTGVFEVMLSQAESDITIGVQLRMVA